MHERTALVAAVRIGGMRIKYIYFSTFKKNGQKITFEYVYNTQKNHFDSFIFGPVILDIEQIWAVFW